MRSFASLAALASIAFASVASALPSGFNRRGGELAEVETTVNNVVTTLNALNGPNVNVANANAHQARYEPSPSDGYHADLLTLVAQATGLTKIEVLTRALAIAHVDLAHLDIHAIVGLLPLDIQILAIVDQYAPWIKVDTIVSNLGSQIDILNGGNINIANAQANQNTGGGNYRRQGSDAINGAGGLGAVLGGLATKTARSEYRDFPDVLVELKATVEGLCHELNAKVSAAASASVALDAAVVILGQIKDHIFVAKAEIEAIVSAHVDTVITLKGKVISVQVVAEICASIVAAICVTISLVLKACASVKTDVLVALIVDITVALAACITLCANIAVGLVVDVRALIDVVIHIIVDLRIEAFIQLFQIGSGY